MRLSKTYLESFAGDIRPLSVPDCSETVSWQVSDSHVVRLKEFAEDWGFTDRVLVVLLNPGTAEITATCGDETMVCKLSVREPLTLLKNQPLRHWIADMHAHSTNIHKKVEFRARESETAEDMVRQVRDEGAFDAFTISDHEVCIDGKEFYNVYAAAEKYTDEDFIVFPGAENQVSLDSVDYYGFPMRSSGEIVTINAEGWPGCKTWEEYLEITNPSRYTIAGLAHPQIWGFSLRGIWGFRLAETTIPGMREIIHFVEMGNGIDRAANLINERVYSTALDCGYRVAPSCGSDHHGPNWGTKSMPGRTVILAPEKKKEYFLDALRSARIYATENGNVKLDYTVNGGRPGDTLPLTDHYEFKIHIEPFTTPADKIAYIEIYSDYGRKVAETTADSDAVDIIMTVVSNTARYFYIRIVSEMGDRTWSSPVWTGREFDVCPLPKFTGKRLDKAGWTINAGAEACINDNPLEPWTADGSSAVLTIDMGEEKYINGFSYYPHKLERKEMLKYASFAGDYVCSVSTDGKHYEKVAEGAFREYCGEQLVRIKPTHARYVRLSILNTSGVCSRKPRYINEPLMIGELNVFQADERREENEEE